MRPWGFAAALSLAACSSVVDGSSPPAECESDAPPGYCESDDDCDEADRCWLERVRDSHVGGDTIPINRCIPRATEGDYCEVGWCAEGLTCDADPASGRGLCVK